MKRSRCRIVIVGTMLALIFTLATPGFAAETPRGLVGRWTFDGNLLDQSGLQHQMAGQTPRFVNGHTGQSLDLTGKSFSLNASPDFDLLPGLTIDCQVFLDQRPAGMLILAQRDQAFQLRVEDPKEGGNLTFFVYLKPGRPYDGWEPRVVGPAIEPGQWYHIVASWSGMELALEVNGTRYAERHEGIPHGGEGPVKIGPIPGRMDSLDITSPAAIGNRWARARMSAAGRRIVAGRFGDAAGWNGWMGDRGARLTASGSAVVAEFTQPGAALVQPSLDVDIARLPYIMIDAMPPADCEADLLFATTAGVGLMPIRLEASRRASANCMVEYPAWRGRLRLLAVVPRLAGRPAGAPPLAIRFDGIRVAAQVDEPLIYIRGLTPGRAILRAGRAEEIVCVVRNTGGPGAASCTIAVPGGVELLDPATRDLGSLAHDATVLARWRIQAKASVRGRVGVETKVSGATVAKAAMDLEIRPPCALPPADYVPRPQPAESDYVTLMHYCPLWKLGTHSGWNKIELWPQRKPAIGFYDEGKPEVADWHIKYALEHGVQGFIYCWYRDGLTPEIHERIGHAVHDGLMKARYRDMFKFVIMWENGQRSGGVKDRDDMMNNLFPYWMKNFFTHPSYLKIDNKPVLFVYQPGHLSSQLGGSEATRKVLDQMRAECRKAGFDGLWIVGCTSAANRQALEQMAAEGYDASSAYNTVGRQSETFAKDPEGLTSIAHDYFMNGQEKVWRDKKAIGALPDIVAATIGWDPRPWHGPRTALYTRDVNAAAFKRALQAAKRVVDATPGNGLDRRVVVLDNWNEFGEGHYIEPCAEFGFSFLDAVRDVFCPAAGPHGDIIPEDVGLDSPDRIYREYRKIIYPNGPGENRAVRDNLVAWWRFEDDNKMVSLDSSNCGFHALKDDFATTAGVSGRAFLCKGGSIACDPDKLFFPMTGLTVELWAKTDVAGQTDRWMVNTISSGENGYRLGLGEGRISWQVPLKDWDHVLQSPKPMPLGRWVHIAATYDNRVMRLYVDGAEVSSLAREGWIEPGLQKVVVGAFGQKGAASAFLGALDEVRIYDRPLRADEIGRRVAEGRAGLP
ncbi:MAG: glycoside hydrolase family 99-like domain-containing protein [bacterium]|nr:glycoside hydrolase family 99-like domain-containing protein [bacterium]